MANLSKLKRDQMNEFLEHLKKQHKDDDKSLSAINEIQTKLTEKKYGLVWEEHTEQVDEEMKTKIPVFTIDSSKTINVSNSSDCNFLLEGDNLHSLTLLEKTHKGKIDVIYIDPPYNTGAKDWKYNNDFVVAEDSFKHSKWISMMKERIIIAKKLLRSDGFFVCAIDHYELFPLGLLLDEIFGENNRIGVVSVVHKPEGRNQEKFFATSNEFALFYAKDIKKCKFQNVVLNLEKEEEFNLSDDKGKYKLEPLIAKNHGRQGDDKNLRLNRPHKYYPIYVSPDCKVITLEPNKGYEAIYPVTKQERTWKYTKDICIEKIKQNEIVALKKNNNIQIYEKYRISKGELIKTHWIRKEYNANIYGTKIIKEILNECTFDFPKSLYLMKDIFKIISNKNSIILDFFAGSGTTGQAVLELNKEDCGNRKFILCTNNENNICAKVTYPRLKTVITGLRLDNSKYSDGIKSNLLYYKTDFVPKESDELSQQLNEHIKEMIQLEIGKIISNKEYPIILTDDDADELESDISKYKDIKTIFIANDVMLTSKQKKLFDKYDIKTIPDNFFEFELREQGEIF